MLSDTPEKKATTKKIAVLFQALNPPIIDGMRKPKKPGGYSDSGADILYNLAKKNIPIVTHIQNPNPDFPYEWVFPDTKEGIENAISKGANVLWANTILFNSHPLEQFAAKPDLEIIGQLPILVDTYDDKWFTNEYLRAKKLPVAPSCLIAATPDVNDCTSLDVNTITEKTLRMVNLDFPLVVKPIRGRGSEGVVLVHNLETLKQTVNDLLLEKETVSRVAYPKYGKALILEKYMPGQEVTVTVMPPGQYDIGGKRVNYVNWWALPIVKRFNHVNGVAPYNGTVAVVENSSLLSSKELADPRYAALQQTCALAAAAVKACAPIRIDCREGADGKFYLFDLNMKPNITGPGRPERENQDCLTAIAAKGAPIHWDYATLIANMSQQSWPANRMQYGFSFVEEAHQIYQACLKKENEKLFFLAAQNGELSLLKSILFKNPELLNQKQAGCTAIYWATVNQKLDVVQYLMLMDAELSQLALVDHGYQPIVQTCFLWAVQKGFNQIVQKLLELNIRPTSTATLNTNRLDEKTKALLELVDYAQDKRSLCSDSTNHSALHKKWEKVSTKIANIFHFYSPQQKLDVVETILSQASKENIQLSDHEKSTVKHSHHLKEWLPKLR